MRSFVSFLADVPSAGTPPGREVAVVLSEMLTSAGEAHDGPEERHGVAWGLAAVLDGGAVECVVKLADTTDERWLAEVSIRRKGLGRFSPKIRPDHDDALREWSVTLHDGLERDPRVSDVRWAGVGKGWW